MSDFDYGEKKPDGQYENYPTVDEGDFQQPVRQTYIHEECGNATTMGIDLAESVARDPDYYTKTFCASCGSHYSVDEFHWKEDGKPWAGDND